MTPSIRSSLEKNVNRLLGVPTLIPDSVSCLKQISSAVSSGREFPFERLSDEQADRLERLLASVLATLRTRESRRPQFALRKIKTSEERLLQKAKSDLNLKMRWKDHICAADTEDGAVIVVEPYGIDSDDYKELAALSSIGWGVTVDDRFATYFPGRAVCLLLRPPTTNPKVSQKPIAAAEVP